MEIFGCVYVIRNLIDGKAYIGKTENSDLSVRWSKHKSLAITGKGYYLHKSMRKHGVDKFIIELLCEAYSKDSLEVLEMAFISLFNATDDRFGFNMTHGGEGGVPTEATRAKLRRERTPEQKERYRLGAIARWKKPLPDRHRANIISGQKAKAPPTAETKAKMSESQRNRVPVSDEHRATMSAAQRLMWSKPEAQMRRDNLINRKKPVWSAEARAAIVASNKRRAGLSKPMPTKQSALLVPKEIYKHEARA